MLDGPLTEAELATALLREEMSVEEAAATAAPAAPPSDGVVVREDSTIRTVIIRPCVSRGARIRGLPPIYTPTMLREHAGVFTNWPMFRDHAIIVQEAELEGSELRAQQQEMAEAIAEQWMATTARLTEAVKKVGRSIDDLAGRITRSWWDPAVVFEDDADFGYQVGGVAGLSLLLPSLREKVAADVGLFHTSINGYPTAGRPSAAPWNAKLKGMMIEGIRKVPMGSVDVVVRGGAGGRFVRSASDAPKAAVPVREVSPVQSGYAASQMPDVKLSEATSPEQLRAWVTEHAPQLVPLLAEGTSAAPPAAAPAAAAPAAAAAPLTRADIDTALREAQEGFKATLAERETAIRTEVRTDIDKADTRDRQARLLETEAHKLIEAATKDKGGFLTPKWAADLKARYSIRPNGPAPALLIEAEETGGVVTKDAITLLRESIKADLDYAATLIAETVGGPIVNGQGGGTPTEREGTSTSKVPARSWLTELDSMGMFEHDDKGAPQTGGLFESMVS